MRGIILGNLLAKYENLIIRMYADDKIAIRCVFGSDYFYYRNAIQDGEVIVKWAKDRAEAEEYCCRNNSKLIK